MLPIDGAEPPSTEATTTLDFAASMEQRFAAMAEVRRGFCSSHSGGEAPTSSPRRALALLCGVLLSGLLWSCSETPWRVPAASTHPPQLGYDRPVSGAPSAAPSCPTPAPVATTAPAAGSRLTLAAEASSMSLGPGRWVVEITVPPQHLVTVGLAGPRKALQRFEIVGRKPLRGLRSGSLEDDGLLPAFVSFGSRDNREPIIAIVDVEAPVTLMRQAVAKVTHTSLEASDLAPAAQRHPLIGLPFGLRRSDGYALQVPPRYAFVRADVAAALQAAFRQTRTRYRRNRIAIGDASQWNGGRPATDIGKPRHISHVGGRDIDIGLPTRKGDISRLKRRCEGVMVEEGRLECGPGTVRNFDASRTAYLLGLLIDGPTPGGRFIGNAKRRPGPLAVVETIFTDQAYIDEIRRALPKLRQRKWIHDEAYGALGEEGLLRPSPWHTDHLHIRFTGAPAQLPEALAAVKADPPPESAGKIRVPTGGPR